MAARANVTDATIEKMFEQLELSLGEGFANVRNAGPRFRAVWVKYRDTEVAKKRSLFLVGSEIENTTRSVMTPEMTPERLAEIFGEMTASGARIGIPSTTRFELTAARFPKPAKEDEALDELERLFTRTGVRTYGIANEEAVRLTANALDRAFFQSFSDMYARLLGSYQTIIPILYHAAHRPAFYLANTDADAAVYFRGDRYDLRIPALLHHERGHAVHDASWDRALILDHFEAKVRPRMARAGAKLDAQTLTGNLLYRRRFNRLKNETRFPEEHARVFKLDKPERFTAVEWVALSDLVVLLEELDCHRIEGRASDAWGLPHSLKSDRAIWDSVLLGYGSSFSPTSLAHFDREELFALVDRLNAGRKWLVP